jgi:GntR family transcriptional regulator
VHHWLELQPPDHFLLIEPDEELRKILAAEIQQAVTLPIECCSLEDSHLTEALEGAIPTALPNKTTVVRRALAEGAELLTLRVNSVPTSLAEWLPAPSGALVGIASRWPGFLKMARTILTAVDFHADGLVFRDARKTNWQRGLKETAAVVCDTVTAACLPKKCRAVRFPLLSEASLDELRHYEEFTRRPLDP